MQKLAVLGAVAFLLVLIPSLLPLIGIAPVWMTNYFYYPVLVIALYAVFLLYQATKSA
jgi:uncharacterized membrane protein